MARCEHPGGERFSVCRHLLESANVDHLVKFTGRGIECDYVCRACVDAPSLVDVCQDCRDRATAAWAWQGIVGAPQIIEEPRAMSVLHRRFGGAWPPLTDLQPVLGSDRNRWMGVSANGTLYELDLDAGTSRSMLAVELELEKAMLRVSPDGKLVAIVDRTGVRGAVIDIAERTTLVPLVRDGYNSEHCVFPIAFFERDGRTLIVHSPEWNRLDIIDARSGAVLTARDTPQNGEPHELDYFHCGISISRDQRFIADNGWVWHPYGVPSVWSLDRWLENPWESEDGDSRRELCGREYYWDGPAAWLAGSEIAIYGYGRDDEWLIPGVRIFDAATGRERRWFPGPRGDLAFDRELYAIDEERGLTVWNVERGARLFAAPSIKDARYHPSAKTFVSLADGTTSVLRGADAQWNRGAVTALATRIARESAFDDLPVLGDALEAEGCSDPELLAHCHAHAAHAGRCWVLDRLGAGPDH